MEFAFSPPPDDFDDCIGLACSLDMRSACHATLGNGSPRTGHVPLCGLLRFAANKRGVWLDVSRFRLTYKDRAVDLSEPEFLLAAAAASGRGDFVPWETVVEDVFGLEFGEEALAYVLDRVDAVRSTLSAEGISENLLETDTRAGLRLAEELG